MKLGKKRDHGVAVAEMDVVEAIDGAVLPVKTTATVMLIQGGWYELEYGHPAAGSDDLPPSTTVDGKRLADHFVVLQHEGTSLNPPQRPRYDGPAERGAGLQAPAGPRSADGGAQPIPPAPAPPPKKQRR